MHLPDIQKLVAGFEGGLDGATAKSRELILALLAHTPGPLSRNQFTPGHITCTGLVLDPAGDRVMLVHHKRLERWLLPGGHVELEDGAAGESARREVLEETGVELDSTFPAVLTGLDVHGIPPKRNEPFHLHHDLVFGFRALSDSALCSPESRAVAWSTPGEFNRYDVPPNVRVALERLLASIGKI